MKICKMHGLGNDFVLVNGFEVSLPENLADFALDICDRHLGIGADGLIIILPSQKADLHFVIYNSDGSEAEMCGNGMRCAAIFSKKEGLCSKDI
ncbi:MAG: diaminopimelate epimerase, partial [Clostridiales bacterium]